MKATHNMQAPPDLVLRRDTPGDGSKAVVARADWIESEFFDQALPDTLVDDGESFPAHVFTINDIQDALGLERYHAYSRGVTREALHLLAERGSPVTLVRRGKFAPWAYGGDSVLTQRWISRHALGYSEHIAGGTLVAGGTEAREINSRNKLRLRHRPTLVNFSDAASVLAEGLKALAEKQAAQEDAHEAAQST